MRQLRVGLLLLILLVDLAIAIYAVAFSGSAVTIRLMVCAVMIACGAYEIYDAKTAIKRYQQKAESDYWSGSEQ